MQKIDAIDSHRKIRQYGDHYLAMRFTWTVDPGCPSPLCIVCGEQIANSAMVTAKLKRHFTLHPCAAKKDVERALNWNKRQATRKKVKINEKAIAEIVAKKIKSHTNQ